MSGIADQLNGTRQAPASFADLSALGVPDAILQVLAALVSEGVREDDVMAAWLASLLDSEFGGLLPEQAQRRLGRAAQRRIVVRVRERLAVLNADAIPF